MAYLCKHVHVIFPTIQNEPLTIGICQLPNNINYVISRMDIISQIPISNINNKYGFDKFNVPLYVHDARE